MKLRNKKTGEIVIVEYISDYQTDDGTEIGFRVKNTLNYYSYPTLAELNKEWEDYKPAEPLIKDENIRKIIRAWAVENDSTRAVYYSPKNELADSYGNSISFNLIFRELNHGAEYTIAELCGEEEECES